MWTGVVVGATVPGMANDTTTAFDAVSAELDRLIGDYQDRFTTLEDAPEPGAPHQALTRASDLFQLHWVLNQLAQLRRQVRYARQADDRALMKVIASHTRSLTSEIEIGSAVQVAAKRSIAFELSGWLFNLQSKAIDAAKVS